MLFSVFLSYIESVGASGNGKLKAEAEKLKRKAETGNGRH